MNGKYSFGKQQRLNSMSMKCLHVLSTNSSNNFYVTQRNIVNIKSNYSKPLVSVFLLSSWLYMYRRDGYKTTKIINQPCHSSQMGLQSHVHLKNNSYRYIIYIHKCTYREFSDQINYPQRLVLTSKKTPGNDRYTLPIRKKILF